MQRRKCQVTSLGDTQRRFDRFQVAHFADEHHVRVFAQRRAKRVREGMRIGVDFALIHQAPLVVVEEFDGVLDGDHVLVALAVDLVEHGGEGGGLTGAGWSSDENEPAGLVAKPLHDRGQAESVKSLDVPRNGAEHRADGATLVEAVSAEARQVLQTKRKVQLQVFFKAMLLRVGQHAISERLGVRGSKRWHVQRAEFPMHTNARSAVRGDVEVASPHFDHLLQQFTQRNPSHPSSSIL